MSDTVAIIQFFIGEPPRLIASGAINGSFVIKDNVFKRCSNFGDWLGFYDWLRTGERSIIGLRLRADDNHILKLFEPFAGPFVIINDGTVTIRTTLEGLIVDDISDDADFGGNSVFRGTDGALAVVFFAPREW